MSNTDIVQINADKISTLTGYSVEEIAVVKKTIAKNVTDTELAYFLSVSRSAELNPFNKEVWCYKDNKNNLLIFAGRDGFLAKAQKSSLWNGLTSFEVCENDEFEINVAEANVRHIPNFKDRGKIIGAYAIVRPKNCELPTVEWAEFKTYNKGRFTWSTHPAEMIKKVAETHALKKAFGISGIQSEYDYEVKDGYVNAINTQKTGIDKAKELIMEGFAKYNGEDKNELRQDCVLKNKTDQFTIEYANELANKIGVDLGIEEGEA